MGAVDNNKEYVDIRKYYLRYKNYWPVIVISFVVFCVLGFFYFHFAPPVLQVNANILIKEDEGISGSTASSSAASAAASQAMQNFAFGGSSSLGGNSVNDELLLLSSYSLFREVGRDLNLNVRYSVDDFPFDKDCYKNSPVKVYTVTPIADDLAGLIKFRLKVSSGGRCSITAKQGWKTIGSVSSTDFPVRLNTKYGPFYFDLTNYYKPKKSLSMDILFLGYDFCAELLQKQITVDQVTKKANVVSLTMEDKNRIRGKEILNTLISLYNENGQVDKNGETKLMDDFLGGRINLLNAELDSVERNIERYKKENNLTDIDEEAKIILDKSQDFKEKQIEAESQYTVIELVEEFLTKKENRYSLVPLNIGLNDKTVLEGLQSYNEALLDRIKLLMTTKPGNPAIDLTNKQIDAMRANMIETVRSIKSGLGRARGDLASQENYFLSRIGNMPTQEREFISIKRQQMIKQELFMFLLQKREENALTQALVKPKAKIVDAAYVLSDPISPKLSVVLILSVVLSFIISLIYIISAECIKKKRSIN